MRVLTFLLGGTQSPDQKGSGGGFGGGGDEGGRGAIVEYKHILGRALHTVISAMRKTKHNPAFAAGLGEWAK